MTKHHWNIIILIALLTIALVLNQSIISWGILVFALFFFSIRLAFGISVIKNNYFFKAINKLENNQVLLTFDDGPHPEYTSTLLTQLEQHQLGAIFFVIGAKAEKYPQLIEQILEKGHIVANHTYNHPNTFALLNQKQVEKEITMGQNALLPFKDSSIDLFRTPIGVTNPIIARAVKATKVKTIGWTLRTKDTVKQDPKNWLTIITKKTKANDIVLFHDTQEMTATHLEEYIRTCQNRGIEFVSIPTLKQLFHA